MQGGSNRNAATDTVRHLGGEMNWETLLYAPVGELLWKKKQDLRLSRNK